MGFTLAGDKDAAGISEEQLDLLDRDLLVWNAGFSSDLRDVLAGNALYQQLAVSREGRVLEHRPLPAPAIRCLTPQLTDTLNGSG